ncbi:MAG: polyamine ABC transporter substrate-binding protein, partial [Sphaerospermopsis kisseleviana]
MDRRFFLLGTSGMIVSQMLIGCNRENESQFKVQVLKGSIPGHVVNQFRKTVQSEVNFKFVPVNQIYDLFKQLQTWQQPDANNKEGWSRLI